MTGRERLIALLQGEVPDHVPVCPDISNMVPCRLTGKQFWDIYLYQDPPLWKAHIDAIKYFGLDGGLELRARGLVDPVYGTRNNREERIVMKNSERIVTRFFYPETETWSPSAVVYTQDNPPGTGVSPENLGLPETPTEWEPVTGQKEWPDGYELWKYVKEYLGDNGIIGMGSGFHSKIIGNDPESVYEYYDNPEKIRERAEQMTERALDRIKKIAELEIRPDVLYCGASGTLVFQTPQMVRELILPGMKKVTGLAKEIGIPTHVHSCGPEKELVKMFAEETDLTIIDPLEIPPMGDCILAEVKERWGDKIILKGNLHTTQTMLNGSADDVRAAGKKAIDDAGKGGGFMLSSGDQCGRDTPDENIFATVEIAESYGKY